MRFPPAILSSHLRLEPLGDGDQISLRAEKEHPRRDSRCRHADLAHRVHGEQLERWAGLDDVDVAVFAGEYSAANAARPSSVVRVCM